MNLKKYIASGVLELYVLDLLTEDKRSEVEKNMIDYPEIKTEIDTLEEVLLIYCTLNARVPPPQMKSSILKEIK